MKIFIIIFLVNIAILHYAHAYAAPKKLIVQAKDRTVTLSNITYDYTMIYEYGQPDCRGDVSFDIAFPSGASKILVAKTRAHLVDYDNPFYSGKFSMDVDVHSGKEHIVFPYISWGTFISVQVIYEDSINPISIPINTSDYLSEEDKSIIFGSLDSPQISDDGQCIGISSYGTILIDSFVGGNLWLYDINGRCIMTDNFQASSDIPLPDSSSSLLILKVRFNDNRIITRKINRSL